MTTRGTSPLRVTVAPWRGGVLLLLTALGCTLDTSASGAQSDRLGKSKAVAPREAVGLNPQPEPPSRTRKKQRLKPGEMRGLNPQPEPPMPANRLRR